MSTNMALRVELPAHGHFALARDTNACAVGWKGGYYAVNARGALTARIESFNGRLRDELLNSWRFDSLLEARVIIED